MGKKGMPRIGFWQGHDRKVIRSKFLRRFEKKVDKSWGEVNNLKYFQLHESDDEEHENFFKYKLLKPIEKKSNEYEQAIMSFLGLQGAKKIEKKKVDNESRSKSTVMISVKKREDAGWAEQLHEIEVKEKQLTKGLKELDLAKKTPIKKKFPAIQSLPKLQQKAPIVKSFINLPAKNEVVKSLHKVSQLLQKVLKIPNLQPKK